MFDIGFSEMILIALIALIVLGPARLPEVARSAGRWVGKARRFVENVKRDIDQEIKSEDLDAFRQMHAELNETRSLLQKSSAETFNSLTRQIDMDDAVNPAALPAPDTLQTPIAKPKKPAKPAAGARVKKKPAVTQSAAPKTNRTPHGGVKKTRTR